MSFKKRENIYKTSPFYGYFAIFCFINIWTHFSANEVGLLLKQLFAQHATLIPDIQWLRLDSKDLTDLALFHKLLQVDFFMTAKTLCSYCDLTISDIDKRFRQRNG